MELKCALKCDFCKSDCVVECEKCNTRHCPDHIRKKEKLNEYLETVMTTYGCRVCNNEFRREKNASD